jgi:hypothetical protein
MRSGTPHNKTFRNLQIPPSELTLNPQKPVLYVLFSDNGAVLWDPQHNHLLKFNKTAIEMWQQLASGKASAQVITDLAQQYHIDPGRVAKDLDSLKMQISHHKLTLESHLLISQQHDPLSNSPPQVSHRTTPDNERQLHSSNVLLVLKAIVGLAFCDLLLSVTSLDRLFSMLKVRPSNKLNTTATGLLTTAVCDAVKTASIWYPRKALCLQRSAITTYLLRRKGVAAHLVIGARPLPFLVHAWVEVDGQVVNDFPRVRDFYQTLASF